jgi:hypothetical protein
MGIRSWRILIIAPSQTNSARYETLRGTRSGQDRFDRYIRKQIRMKQGMAVQITHNKAPNSVVLVAPDGTFLTEATIDPKKITLDEKFPKQPRLKNIFDKVNREMHAERYLS